MLFDAAATGDKWTEEQRTQSPQNFKEEWLNGKAAMQYTGYGFNDSKELHKVRNYFLRGLEFGSAWANRLSHLCQCSFIHILCKGGFIF